MTIRFTPIVSDTDHLSRHLCIDTTSQADFAKPESIFKATTIPDTLSFREPKYFHGENIWRTKLRLNNESKLNEEALKAVDRLKFLLAFSESKVAEIVGVSRNSIRNWRKGQGAYPNTTNKLFQVSHLISALKSVMNQRQMLAWLNEPDNKNPSFTRLDILARPDGPALVSQQASHILFPPPPGSLPSPDELRKELERIDLEEQGWMEEHGEVPRRYSARPRRQRPDGNMSK